MTRRYSARRGVSPVVRAQRRKSSSAALTGSGRSSGSRCAASGTSGSRTAPGTSAAIRSASRLMSGTSAAPAVTRTGICQLAESADRRWRQLAHLDRAERQLGGEGTLVHLLGERDQLGVDVLRLASRADHPEPHLTGRARDEVVGVDLSDQVVPEVVRLVGPLVAGDCRVEQRERAHPVGVGQRGVDGDRPAEGAADQGGPGQVERVQQPGHVVVVRERGRGELRVAVAAQVQGRSPGAGWRARTAAPATSAGRRCRRAAGRRVNRCRPRRTRCLLH